MSDHLTTRTTDPRVLLERIAQEIEPFTCLDDGDRESDRALSVVVTAIRKVKRSFPTAEAKRQARSRCAW